MFWVNFHANANSENFTFVMKKNKHITCEKLAEHNKLCSEY